MDIPLHDAYYYLSQCKGVLIEDRFIEPIVYEIEEEYDNIWLYLEWETFTDEGAPAIVTVCFNEKDNQNVLLEGSSLWLINTEGEEEELILLKEWDPNNI